MRPKKSESRIPTIGDRIRSLRTAAGLSRAQLAEAIGLSEGAVRNHEQDANVPGAERIAEYARALGVPADAILSAVNVKAVPVVVGRPKKYEPFSVPLRGVVAAGQPLEAFDSGERLVFTELFGGDSVFALEVRGDSMTDAGILPGDYVIVRGRPEASNGETVVAELAGSITLKVYQKRGGVVYLFPRNESAKPIAVDPAKSDVRIVGAMIGVVRSCRG